MEPSGRNGWQPVANGRPPENRSNKPIRNRWQPTAMLSERMVRRGSTVRVRQRALQKRGTPVPSRSERLAPSQTADIALSENEKKTGELVEAISEPSEAERR